MIEITCFPELGFAKFKWLDMQQAEIQYCMLRKIEKNLGCVLDLSRKDNEIIITVSPNLSMTTLIRCSLDNKSYCSQNEGTHLDREIKNLVELILEKSSPKIIFKIDFERNIFTAPIIEKFEKEFLLAVSLKSAHDPSFTHLDFDISGMLPEYQKAINVHLFRNALVNNIDSFYPARPASINKQTFFVNGVHQKLPAIKDWLLNSEDDQMLNSSSSPTS